MSYICIYLGHFQCSFFVQIKVFVDIIFLVPENFLCHFLKCKPALKFSFVEKAFFFYYF